MRILFASAAVCFCGLLYLLLSAARHIRATHHKPTLKTLPTRPPNELFEAGDFRTPRALPLLQSVSPRHTTPDAHYNKHLGTVSHPNSLRSDSAFRVSPLHRS